MIGEMDSETDVYRELQKHLDKMPIGYPATTTGVELRLLKFLFTPEQARIALALDYRFQTAEQIYARVNDWGMSLAELKTTLEEMANKGNTFCKQQDGVTLYANMPFVIGMLELQETRLTPEFLKDTNEYYQGKFAGELAGVKVPQTRIIPVGKSIKAEHRIATYDELRDIIAKAEGRIRVGECICRKTAQMSGHTCAVTSRQESCMAFRDFADLAGRAGWGRPLGREEALQIAAQSEEEGLVLQPANEEDPQFICSCCGDCCGLLRLAKALPQPTEFFASNYYAQGDSDLCTGCGTCADRCQMAAIELQNNIAVVNRDRCVGCGVCVPTCPSGSKRLVKKEEEVVPPKDMEALFESIMAHKRAAVQNPRI